MLFRLFAGLIKGLVLGGLVGYGLVALGWGATPGPLLGHAAAAAVGVLVGLVAGKPIWAKDAQIEAGMKALVGALLGAGLFWALRRWVEVPLPLSLGELGGPNLALGETPESLPNGSLAGVGVTALASVAAVLGAFYDLDNTPPTAAGSAGTSSGGAPASRLGEGRVRVGGASAPAEEDRSVEAGRRARR